MGGILNIVRKTVETLSFLKRKKRIGRFDFDAVFDPEELDEPQTLPLELQFVLRKADIKEDLKRLLGKEGGDKGIAVRTTLKTPERVLRAVERIAVLTQHRCITTWLSRLIKHGTRPVFTQADHEHASRKGVELHEEVGVIMREASQFKQFAIIDEENTGITKNEHDVLDRMNSLMVPLEAEYAVNRIVFDNAHERTQVAQAIIKVMLIVGPVTHILEKFARGIGKVFAASADDVMSEAAELMALRGSGFTWRELAQRSKILIPIFILATYGAFTVERLIEKGWLHAAGAVFGLSAVALSLTTAVQSIRLYQQNVVKLLDEGKLILDAKNAHRRKRAIFWEAVRQDFTNPARLGLFLGALFSPLAAMMVFAFLPKFVHNGWVLALLGATETLVAGATVYLAGFINERMFHKKISESMTRLPVRR